MQMMHPGAKHILRQLNTMDYGSGQRRTLELERGEVLIALALNLRGQATLAAGSNTRALLERGDEWSIVRRCEIIVNNHTRMFSVPGWQLPWIEMMDTGGAPNVSLYLGDAGADPAFDSTVYCYFSPPRMNLQTPLDLRPTSAFRLEIDWGTVTDLNAAATAWAAEPIMEIYALVCTCGAPHPPDGAYRQVLSFDYPISGNQDKFRVPFPQGPRYAQFALFPTNNDINDPGIVQHIDWRALSCSYLEGRYAAVAQIAAKEWGQGFIPQAFSQAYPDATTTSQYGIRQNFHEPTHGVLLYDQAKGDFWAGVDAADLDQLRLELQVTDVETGPNKINGFYAQYLHSLCVNR